MNGVLDCGKRGLSPLFPLLRKKFSDISGLAAVVLAAALFLPTAEVQAFPATQCAPSRFGGNLGCTANDVSINTITIAGTPPPFCVGGQSILLNLNVTIQFQSPSRYDVGVFVSADGQSPQLLPPTGAASCTVAVLPTASPFLNLDGDSCGDGNGTIGAGTGAGTFTMTNVAVPCITDGSGNAALSVPYLVSWDNGSTTLCSDNTFPVPGTTSKCNTGTVTFPPGYTISVLPVISITDGVTTVRSGGALTYTVVITNTTASPMAAGAIFTSPAVTDLNISSVNCVAAGGATCPASPTVAAMQGAGITLPAMPNNSSLTFTVSGTYTGNPISPTTLTNTASVTASGYPNSASDTDTVMVPPTVTKSFSPGAIASGGTSTLTITLTNPTTTVNITGAGFADTYPANMKNAATPALTNTCGGTATAAANGTSLSLSGGTIPAGGSCSVSVSVTTTATGTNTTGTVTSGNAASGSAATATLNVISMVNSTVVASPTTVINDGVTTSTITVTLNDSVGNPVAGKTITLTAGSGSSTITTVSGVTNASGQATFTVKDTVVETVTYTAKDTTDNITLTQTAQVAFKPVTTLDTGTDPAAATIAPGAAATDVDLFTLRTSSGTEAITSVTVNLSTSSGIGRLAITNNAGTELGFTTSPTTGSNTITVAGMSATATLTTYKVRVTPLSHAAMPVPPGGAYAITSPVTAWAGSNTHTGSDTNPNALTIDNLSPTGATATSGTAGIAQVTLNWTTSASTDFSRSVMLRWTGGTAGAEVPAEGTNYVNGNTITSATVVCVRTADAAATAVSGIDGAGTGGCSATALTIGQAYTYKIFQKDSNGNYDVGVPVGSFTPPLPTVVSINCSVSCAATSASTVSWTVTFSMSVTGVDATAFSLAASGLSGAYITTVTGSGTTWTVTANTGIGAGTLGLDQTGPGSVSPTLSGTFTGQVYPISSTPALAEYRMDEASWNGTANEVVDSSGSGNNAQAFNSANTTVVTGQEAKPGNPGTCRYGVFDNGGTITQGYVQTPLPNLTTDFTITAWIRTTDNTVAGQRILIDDQNNTGGYGLSLGDGGTGKLRFYSRGITPAILDSTYTIASNTWFFVAAVADITNKKRTIYVFNQSGVLQNSTTEAAWTGGAWGTDAGPVSIGAETNASAETPLNFHFRGNLDEVRVYQKVLNQAAATTIAAQTHACAVNIPDHLEIQSSGSGLTCAASTLTIRACANAACTTLYTSGVSGTLSATGAPTVNWDGTTGGAAGAGFVIPNGSSSVTKNVQVATAGTVVFGITSPSPVPASATACNFGSPSCTFTASLAGFIFSDTTTGNSYTIPSQVSGIATPTLYLRAVQASTTNPAVCTPAIISQPNVSVNMGYVCNNPASCQAGNLATINATPIPSGGTAVSLNFDANGSAPITARYDDVGQITLNANKTVTPFGGATAVTLNGTSNAFVVKPHHFDLSAIQQTAAPNLVNPAAANAAGAKFVKAGEQFSVTVTARNFANAATPNFGKEAPAESVRFVDTSLLPADPNYANHGKLVAPAGGINPAVSGTFGAFSNGEATGTTFTWNEVGIITLTPSILSGNYLGVAGDTTGTASGNVGRFIPDHFDTTVTGGITPCTAGLLAMTPTCPATGFVYADQPFTTTVMAMNAADGQTQNYTGAFAKAVTLSAVNATSGAITVGGILNGSLLATDFTNGQATTPVVTAPSPTKFHFTTPPTAPTNMHVKALESEVSSSVTTPANHPKEGGFKVVSGRIKISNAYGSELLPLTLTATVQYNIDGTANGWVTSTTDNVDAVTAAKITRINCTNKLLVSGVCSATLGTISSVVTVPTTPPPYGVFSINLGAPGAGNPGSEDLIVNIGGWPAYLPSNTARATFGVYKGRNEFIYLRENY